MLSNPTLNVVISLIFIYLLYSLMATIIQELISTRLALRAQVLEKAIIRMLENDDSKHRLLIRPLEFLKMFRPSNNLIGKPVAAWFYAHPMIKKLGEDAQYSKPAYLDSGSFAKVIIDLLRGADDDMISDEQKITESIESRTINNLRLDISSDNVNPAVRALKKELEAVNSKVENQQTMMNGDTAYFLRTIWKDSKGDIDVFKANLEKWFNDTMDRATGWYKKHVKFILFFIGLGIAMTFNVDTIQIVNTLTNQPEVAAELADNAERFVVERQQLIDSLSKVDTTVKNYRDLSEFHQADSVIMQRMNDLRKDIDASNNLLSLSYSESFWKDDLFSGKWWDAFLGWLITALAISLGAPFWFDLLNKFMKLRGTGSKEASTQLTTNAQPAAAGAKNETTIQLQTNAEEAVG